MTKTPKHPPKSRTKRILIDIAGFGLMIIAPFLGWLPGPGGIPLFLAGLGLVSTNHKWARDSINDFDVRRIEFTDKFLMAGWAFSIIIDLICIAFISVGVYLAFTADALIVRAISVGMTSFALILILSNQKRLDRIVEKMKRK